jgi:hypothetical protein
VGAGSSRRYSNPPLFSTDQVTPLHLARELVYADGRVRVTLRDCQWDEAERWQSYREMVVDWRYDALRGWPPDGLCVCPLCGRVLCVPPGRAICFACGNKWTVFL